METFSLNREESLEELKQGKQALLGDISFLEMIIPNERSAELRNGSLSRNTDEEHLVSALRKLQEVEKKISERI